MVLNLHRDSTQHMPDHIAAVREGFDPKPAGRYGIKKRSQDDAGHSSDPEIDRRTREGQQIHDSLTGRRDKCVRLHTYRIEIVETDNAGEVPPGWNEEANNDAGENIVVTAAKRACCERVDDQTAAKQRCDDSIDDCSILDAGSRRQVNAPG